MDVEGDSEIFENRYSDGCCELEKNADPEVCVENDA
jgi:hypothetical protein